MGLIALVALACSTRPGDLWEIPAGYRGWVVASYEDPRCPALAAERGRLVYRVDAAGRACTSSTFPEGVASDE